MKLSISFQSALSAGSLNLLQVFARAANVRRQDDFELPSLIAANMSVRISMGKGQICMNSTWIEKLQQTAV